MSLYTNPGLHPLPPGWESRISVRGRTYYVGMETLVKPSTSLLSNVREDYHSPERKAECINDNTSTGTWVDPQRQPPALDGRITPSSNPHPANVGWPISNTELSPTPEGTTIRGANMDDFSGSVSTMPEDPKR